MVFRHPVELSLFSDVSCHTPIPRFSETVSRPPVQCGEFCSAVPLYEDVGWFSGSRHEQQPF